MLKRYEEFLKILDERLAGYFDSHKEYICCNEGCSYCCEAGEYPFSRLEAEYIMKGYLTLPPELQKLIKQNIKDLISSRKDFSGKRFTYKCPFLINSRCAVYKYRGLVCRTFGLAYLCQNVVRLPDCTNSGLNYSKLYDPNAGQITLDNPIKEDLHIDKLMKSSLAETFQLECGEIRPLIDWFIN